MFIKSFEEYKANRSQEVLFDDFFEAEYRWVDDNEIVKQLAYEVYLLEKQLEEISAKLLEKQNA